MICSELQRFSSVALANLGVELRALKHAGCDVRAFEYFVLEPCNTEVSSPRALILSLHRKYGADEQRLRYILRALNSLCLRFLEIYGDGPVRLMRAPARINILGEHIDYVSYLPTASLPFGSREHDMLMLYRVSETDRIRGASLSQSYPGFDFSLGGGPSTSVTTNAETTWLSYLYENAHPAPHWGNYVKGAVYFGRVKLGDQMQRGFDFIVDSSIPPGGGASSSSALVVLASAAIYNSNGITYTPEELARDAAKAEWYVGTRGGAMDHLAICLARRGHAVLIAYREETARLVPLPGSSFRWVTFFSHSADKGRDVMIEYNERAAVSRILIPALIERWKLEQPERYSAWLEAIESFEKGSLASLDAAEKLLDILPQTLALEAIEQDYPEAFYECSRAFPALVNERGSRPLELRARALHHLGEVRRVAIAQTTLDAISQQAQIERDEHLESAMRLIGGLLNESHDSLRDLYGVSTSELERLVQIIRSQAYVYGARLMGGGFGGNVLALTNQEDVSSLVARVQEEYYAPRGRQGIREGSVMISTPGDGLAAIGIESVFREALEQFNAMGHNAVQYRASMAAMIDSIGPGSSTGEVRPVIVAAGKGVRARAAGLDVPKPLAAVLGSPAILHVMRNLRAAFEIMLRPLVIVSPETEPGIRAALDGEEVTFVVQPQALGTGDAVLCAYDEMSNFRGRAFVIWSTQPVIRAKTMKRTVKLATLFDDYEMVLPTALKQSPYAPLLRDEHGRVIAARETHLELAENQPFGETNIGLFVIKSQTMFRTLLDLKRRYFDESRQCYKRPGDELGFPNELISSLSANETGVFACPIADSREEQGIKEVIDIPRCEKFISEFQEEQ